MLTNIYVDGFNLYYGCLQSTPYRWLDIDALAKRLLPQHQINRIRYFTAKVDARPHDPSQPVRQDTYLRALQTFPIVSVHLGHYRTHKVRMPLANPPASGPSTVEVLKSEEKGSDVNIATYLLVDGFDGDYEQAVVVSNDSDLKTPIEVVRQKLNLPVGVIFPTSRPKRHPSQDLLAVATFTREIREKILPSCQLPPVVAGNIHKPATW